MYRRGFLNDFFASSFSAIQNEANYAGRSVLINHALTLGVTARGCDLRRENTHVFVSHSSCRLAPSTTTAKLVAVKPIFARPRDLQSPNYSEMKTNFLAPANPVFEQNSSITRRVPFAVVCYWRVRGHCLTPQRLHTEQYSAVLLESVMIPSQIVAFSVSFLQMSSFHGALRHN